MIAKKPKKQKTKQTMSPPLPDVSWGTKNHPQLRTIALTQLFCLYAGLGACCDCWNGEKDSHPHRKQTNKPKSPSRNGQVQTCHFFCVSKGEPRPPIWPVLRPDNLWFHLKAVPRWYQYYRYRPKRVVSHLLIDLLGSGLLSLQSVGFFSLPEVPWFRRKRFYVKMDSY